MPPRSCVDGELITSLDDGRILKLPAERIRRLLAVMADLIEAARRTADGGLLLPDAEAASVLDLEDLLTDRGEENAGRDRGLRAAASAGRRRSHRRPIPASFTATVLRPLPATRRGSQLQHLRAHRPRSAFLADDMGLDKTAEPSPISPSSRRKAASIVRR